MERFTKVAIGLAITTALALGCSSHDDSSVRQIEQGITDAQHRILSLEAPQGDWSANNGSSIAQSTDVTDGSFSLEITPNGYTEISSIAFSGSGLDSDELAFDLMLSESIPWGEVRLVVKIPSAGHYWTDIGGVQLQGFTSDVFHPVVFDLPASVQGSLSDAPDDLSLLVVLNVPWGSGQYILDNIDVSTGVGQEPEGEAQEHLITLPLPAGGDVRDHALVANGDLLLRDRAELLNEVGELFPIWNVGGGVTSVGVNGDVGPLTSHASVFLQNNSTVRGNLTTDGTLDQQAGSIVTGETIENGDLEEPLVLRWPRPIESDASSPDVILAPETAQTLLPGSYDDVIVYSRSTLTLLPGNYSMNKFQLEPEATLVVQPSELGGPVAVYVQESLIWRAGTDPLDASGLLVVYEGEHPIKLEEDTGMAFVAPNALVEFATGGADHRGSVYARGIGVDPEASFTYVPFDYWDWVLPPRPYVSCVMSAGNGTFAAAFGYENQRTVTIQVPEGANNSFSPTSSRGIHVLDEFISGDHPETVWVDMPESGVVWDVYGQQARATTQSPGCTFEHSLLKTPSTGEPRVFPRSNIPTVPAWSKSASSVENALGAGRQRLTITADPWMRLASAGPVPLAAKPNIPLGSALFITPWQTVSLQAIAVPKNEGIISNQQAYLRGKIDGHSFSEQHVVDASDWCAAAPVLGRCRNDTGTRIFAGQTNQATATAYTEFREHDELSADELTDAELTIDLLGNTWDAHFRSRKKKSNGDIEFKDSANRSGMIGEWETYEGHKGDELEVRVFTSEVPSSFKPVRICATWPAYFVDEALSDAPFQESFVGQEVEGSRVRAYPASFARYEILSRGALGQNGQQGVLDRDGCIPAAEAVSDQFLIYLEDAQPGMGGLELYMRLEGYISVDGTATTGPAFSISDGGAVVEFEFETLNDFSDSQDATTWDAVGGYHVPPAEIRFASASYSHATTVAAAMSHSMVRMLDEGVVLPATEYPVTIGSLGSVPHSRDFTCRSVEDSNAGTGRLFIGEAIFPCDDGTVSCTETCTDGADCASGLCDAGLCRQTIDCRRECDADEDCLGGQACMTPSVDYLPEEPCDGGECYCAYPPQGMWKYITSHELGHLVQLNIAGSIAGTDYKFQCPTNGSCELFGRVVDGALQDPPLINDLCACNHVFAANGLHCLQSVEVTPQAQGEGYAQFFASLMWNDNPGSCLFNYYKEVLDEDCRLSGSPDECSLFNGNVKTFPPVPVDCGSPVRWRNQNQCVVSGTTTGGEIATKVASGTEWDWMTFLRELNGTLTFTEIMDVYKAACDPTVTPTTPPASVPLCDFTDDIFWFDDDVNGNGVLDRVGFLNGVERRYGVGSLQAQDAANLGFSHGTGDDVTPL